MKNICVFGLLLVTVYVSASEVDNKLISLNRYEVKQAKKVAELCGLNINLANETISVSDCKELRKRSVDYPNYQFSGPVKKNGKYFDVYCICEKEDEGKKIIRFGIAVASDDANTKRLIDTILDI